MHDGEQAQEESQHERVGVRDFRQELRTYLRRAEAGETIVVTDRGRPVVQLGPVPTRTLGPIDQAIADGLMTKGTGILPTPLPANTFGGRSLSEEVIRARRDERY